MTARVYVNLPEGNSGIMPGNCVIPGRTVTILLVGPFFWESIPSGMVAVYHMIIMFPHYNPWRLLFEGYIMVFLVHVPMFSTSILNSHQNMGVQHVFFLTSWFWCVVCFTKVRDVPVAQSHVSYRPSFLSRPNQKFPTSSWSQLDLWKSCLPLTLSWVRSLWSFLYRATWTHILWIYSSLLLFFLSLENRDAT